MSVNPFRLAALLLLALCASASGQSGSNHPLRAGWVDNGLIINGLNHEAYIFRVRRGGPSLRTDEWEHFLAEHKEEAVIELKNRGIEVFHTHGYKGFGYEAEKPEMELLKELSKHVHKHGMKMSCYCQAMTLAPETFFVEEPRAKDWVQRDAFGQPIMLTYGFQQSFRYKPNIAHPEYRRYYKEKIIKTLVTECGADLLHIDNFDSNPEPESDHSPVTVEAFRNYLRNKYTRAELIERFGHANMDYITPPLWNLPNNPRDIEIIGDPGLQEWIDFRCWLHADFLREVSEYARSLNPDVAVDTNPHGLFGTNRAFQVGIWHPWFLKYTEATYTEEANLMDYNDKGVLISKIRSYKMGRILNNYILTNQHNERSMAENLAFNQTLGAVERASQQYIDFYRKHRDLYTGTRQRADVAVLRCYPSMAYSHRRAEFEVSMVEQALIQSQVPFAIIFDEQMDDLSRYKVLVLAGQNNLPDEHVERIRKFVKAGGGLMATGATSFFDHWGRLRPKPALADLLGLEANWKTRSAPTLLRSDRLGQVVKERTAYLPEVIPPAGKASSAWEGSWNGNWILPENWREIATLVLHAAGRRFTLKVDAPDCVAVEQMEKEGMILVHLVNYRKDSILEDLPVEVEVGPGKKVREVRIVSPEPASEAKVSFEMESGRCSFDVPRLEVYDVVVVELGQ
ncbi:MAG TPA: alpha-amylase family protein [archaeon]|nr:alpha-amylase family protein [archaeon]